MSLLDLFLGVDTPKLDVPTELKPTLDTRGWLIYPFNGNPTWTALVAILPALLGTILIFMDQQITAVIVNRKENKLKKGCGYHLDLFVLAILIQICSVMGLPWSVINQFFGLISLYSKPSSFQVCGRHCAEHQSCQFTKVGVGDSCSGRETPVPRRTRAACDAYFDFPDDRPISPLDSPALAHSHASAVWRFPLHGRQLPKGSAVLRPPVDHVYAC